MDLLSFTSQQPPSSDDEVVQVAKHFVAPLSTLRGHLLDKARAYGMVEPELSLLSLIRVPPGKGLSRVAFDIDKGWDVADRSISGQFALMPIQSVEVPIIRHDEMKGAYVMISDYEDEVIPEDVDAVVMALTDEKNFIQVSLGPGDCLFWKCSVPTRMSHNPTQFPQVFLSFRITPKQDIDDHELMGYADQFYPRGVPNRGEDPDTNSMDSSLSPPPAALSPPPESATARSLETWLQSHGPQYLHPSVYQRCSHTDSKDKKDQCLLYLQQSIKKVVDAHNTIRDRFMPIQEAPLLDFSQEVPVFRPSIPHPHGQQLHHHQHQFLIMNADNLLMALLFYFFLLCCFFSHPS